MSARSQRAKEVRESVVSAARAWSREERAALVASVLTIDAPSSEARARLRLGVMKAAEDAKWENTQSLGDHNANVDAFWAFKHVADALAEAEMQKVG